MVALSSNIHKLPYKSCHTKTFETPPEADLFDCIASSFDHHLMKKSCSNFVLGFVCLFPFAKQCAGLTPKVQFVKICSNFFYPQK